MPQDLLPPFDLIGGGRGRRCGRECSAWTNGEHVFEQAKQVYELLETQGSVVDVYVPLWILGFAVPFSRIRAGLKKPLESSSNDVAVEVDGRNAIEDLIDDAAFEFTRVIKRDNMEPFDVPQDTLAAFMNTLLNANYDFQDQPFQDGVDALRGWEQGFQEKVLKSLDGAFEAERPNVTNVDNGLTVFAHAPFVNKYLSVPRLMKVVERCSDQDLLAVSRDLQIGREIVLEFRRLLLLVMPYFPEEIKLTSRDQLSSVLSFGKICVWADLSLRLKGYGELIESILQLMLGEIRKHFGETLEGELAEVGPQITMLMETLFEELGSVYPSGEPSHQEAIGHHEDSAALPLSLLQH